VLLLGAPSPAVSATNLLYDVVASSAGAAAFLRRGGVDDLLLRGLLLGVLPGMVLGVGLRSTWLADAGQFAWPAALVLGGLGSRLVREGLRPARSTTVRDELPAAGRLAVVGAYAGSSAGSTASEVPASRSPGWSVSSGFPSSGWPAPLCW
jgi:uncharacterized membrane protein YfcA